MNDLRNVYTLVTTTPIKLENISIFLESSLSVIDFYSHLKGFIHEMQDISQVLIKGESRFYRRGRFIELTDVRYPAK